MVKAKVLVVDDDNTILYAFRELLRKEGFKYVVATNGEEALKKISQERPDLIFMDITMPAMDGLEVLKRMQEQKNRTPVIIITGFGTMQTAIKAIQLGAFDYLTKPLDVSKIRLVMERALAGTQSKPVSAERQLMFNADIVDQYALVGNTATMYEIYKLIGSISTTPNHTSVLITGESGTGKELVARAVHNNSRSSNEPFVGINCTVLPETLLETELFGHEKGAFTGAGDRKFGKFEVARGGSIFLDEISNLSLNLQQKLLRVLQEREFERVGGNESVRVDARFIAATNRDLDHEVKKGKFGEDLLFRLNVVSVHLPPLRERREDIPLLANYFLSKYTEQLKKNVRGFSTDAMRILEQYQYPGNVRELKNLVERAVILAKSDIIMPAELNDMLKHDSVTSFSFPIPSPIFSKSRDVLLKMFEKQFIVEQLKKYGGNVTAAAKASKMTRQNFQRLITKHKIRTTNFRS
ncbi:MAG: sigma-54-dependent Fis family transcriptional regulator [Ignavibacteriales bacterium]|nr:sigma-54-dependent Fis family transcriptional regulator [Ignavibacteriales bacterium]